MDFPLFEDRCEALRRPNYVQLAVSTVIVIGLLISYLPQHHRIISRGTSEGISPWFVLLGTTSATAGFANMLTVEPSRADMACCRVVESFECATGMLGIVQLGVQWLSFAVILVLFLVFFRYEDAAVPEEELRGPPPRWQMAVVVGALCLFHGLVVIVLTGVFALALPGLLNFWANLLGVSAAALAAVQYLPQIYTTYRLKHVGSLSIPMMLIQTPGGFLFTASLYGRLGWAGWSTWGIFLLTAVMQGILLSFAIYYEVAARSGGTAAADHSGLGAANGNADRGRSASPPPAYEQPPRRRRPGAPARTYSEGLEEGLPGPFTGHPERYADTPEEMERLMAREERQVAKESRPLLRPGGIGNPIRSRDRGGGRGREREQERNRDYRTFE